MPAISIEIRSSGYSVGNSASILINGSDVAPGRYGRGLNVAVADQSTGRLISFEHYDTHGSSAAADAFAAAVDAWPAGRLVLIAVQDDAQQKLTDRARTTCQTLGSALIDQLGYRGSWALLGQKGGIPGTRPEALDNAAIVISATFELQPAADAGYAVRALSAGYEVGDRAEITIDGTLVPIAGGYGRGMNVAIVDPLSIAVIQTGTFDTYASREASDAFAALLESLPTGRIAIVVVKDDATGNLTERARLACEAIGSAQIRNLAHRGSWAIIGTKNTLSGRACESLSNVSLAGCCTSLQAALPTQNYFTLTVQSAGADFGNSAAVFVDSVAVIPAKDARRGYNIAVLNPDRGVVITKGMFDLYGGGSSEADAMARFLDAVPVGSPVAVAVRDEGALNLNANAQRALATIGAALIGNIQYRNSYALLGCKGAAPGSVPEMLLTNGAGAASFRFPLNASRYMPLDTVSVYSAGFTVGNSAAIVVDGTTVEMPAGYGRGLNVVMLARDGTIHFAKTYDTYLDSKASTDFAALVETAHAGQVFAIAVKDEATRHLTERARQACRSIGSALIGQLSYRGSWAIVGAKGRPPGTAAECLSNTKPAFSSSWVSARVENAQGVWVGAQSAGRDVGDFAAISVNGTPIAHPGWQAGRGLNVAVLDEATGELLSIATYDTHASPSAADALAEMIEALPPGRLVAVAVKDDASRSLTNRARRACGTLGSSAIWNLSDRGSWALIGYKGSAPGSALELMQPNAPASVQHWQGFFSTDPARAAALGISFLGWVLVAVVALAVVALIVAIVLTSVLPRPSPVVVIPERPRRRIRGVFVGVDYTRIPGLNLNGLASRIVGDYYRTVVNTGYFTAADTMLLLESGQDPNLPSKTNIIRGIRWLLTNAQDGDVLYFHYLGHGNRDTLHVPPYELLVTLNDDLTAREITTEMEIRDLVKNLSPKINFTFVFHCCFSGDMIDGTASGRGIALGSSSEVTPTLLDPIKNMSTRIGVSLQRSHERGTAVRTYSEMLQYIRESYILNLPVLTGNPMIYNLAALHFLESLVVADRERHESGQRIA